MLPAFSGGQMLGVKLFFLAPQSVFARAGLQSGDLVTRVNGVALVSPEHMLEAWSAARDSPHLRVDVVREGRGMVLNMFTWTLAGLVKSASGCLEESAPAPPIASTRSWELVGTRVDPEPRLRSAVLRDVRTGRSRTVREGDAVEGQRVQHITRGRVLVSVWEQLEVILPPRGTHAWVEESRARPPVCR